MIQYTLDKLLRPVSNHSSDDSFAIICCYVVNYLFSSWFDCTIGHECYLAIFLIWKQKSSWKRQWIRYWMVKSGRFSFLSHFFIRLFFHDSITVLVYHIKHPLSFFIYLFFCFAWAAQVEHQRKSRCSSHKSENNSEDKKHMQWFTY